MSKIKIALIGLVAVLILGGLSFYSYEKNKFPKNNDTATGNTSGNLLNGGLFCEYNGKIYFANPYDNNYLYVMDSDCSNAKQLNQDSVAYINIHNDYIYYVKNNFDDKTIGTVFRNSLYGVYRTDINGQNPLVLYNHPSGPISLCGNYIFYQHYDNETALTLHRINTDGKNDMLISDTEYNPSSVYNGQIFFSNIDHKNIISCMDSKTGNIKPFLEANSYLVNLSGNHIYYIDIANNYSLMRVNKDTKTIELLYATDNNKIVNYNVYNNKIFFQLEGENNPGLYRMNTDGTQIEYIATGDLTNIHCTSKYTFFQYYNSQGVLYRIPTTGPVAAVEEIRITK